MPTPSLIHIDPSTLKFLADLEKHNERPWFEAHKERYLAAHGNAIEFADAVLAQMRQHDKLSTADGKFSLQRIYNDLRFHKDRPPYKA